MRERSFRNYEPVQFAEVYSAIGADLEHFLTKHDNMIRVETATRLGRPAAEALARLLLWEFGDRVRDLRVRQLFGHMLRHLMQQNGCILDQEEVRIPNGELFTRAARYRFVEQRWCDRGVKRGAKIPPCTGKSILRPTSFPTAAVVPPRACYECGFPPLIR
jgi:hypothetical protein